MVLRQVDKIYFGESESLSSEPYESELDVHEKEIVPVGLALHQVFNKDMLDTTSLQIENLAKTAALEVSMPSFWKKLVDWWTKSELTTSPSEPSTSIQKDPLATPIETIHSVPVLEPPPSLPPDLSSIQIPPVSKKTDSTEKLTESQLVEGLSLMSSQTIDAIMFLIFKAQIELEKENANIAEGTFSKYQASKKIQEGILQDIKDILAKDEKIAGYFKTAQNIALFASFFCGLAAAAASYGLLAPVGAFVGGVAGVVAQRAFMSIVEWGPVVTASLTGLTTGAKAYFQRRLNEDKARHESVNHQDKYYGHRIDDARERLMSTVDMDQTFKERLMLHLKRSSKMIKIVLAK